MGCLFNGLLCLSKLLYALFLAGMFDNDASGKIDIYEFEKLYNYINQWLQVFKTYDQDGSGHIEEGELTQGELLKIVYNKLYIYNFIFCFFYSIYPNGLSFHAGIHQFSGQEK